MIIKLNDNDKEIIAMARSWDEAVNELADTRGQYDTGKSLAVLRELNTKKEAMAASALKKFQVTRIFFKNATGDNDDFDVLVAQFFCHFLVAAVSNQKSFFVAMQGDAEATNKACEVANVFRFVN